MQKAGNIWGSGEEEEVSTFFQVRRGESKGGRKGEREREKEAICGCLYSVAGCGRGELSHSRLLIRNVRLMGVRVPGN